MPAWVRQEHAWGALRECTHRLLVLGHWGSTECSGHSHVPLHPPLSTKTPSRGRTKSVALTSATYFPALQSNLLQC